MCFVPIVVEYIMRRNINFPVIFSHPHFTQLTTPFLPTIRLKWGKTEIFKTIKKPKKLSED